MRLDGYHPAAKFIRLVWDCERCRELRNVEWVDDEENTYRKFLEPLRLNPDNTTAGVIVQARKIEIRLDLGVILINPIADVEPVLEEVEARA